MKTRMPAAKAAREAAGLSLETVAAQAGCCVDYLRRIETGRGTCSYPLALRLARIYRVSANVFLLKSMGRRDTAQQEAIKKPVTHRTGKRNARNQH